LSSAVYPTLAGLAFSVGRNLLAPPVMVRTTPSQREYRGRSATAPRYQYKLTYEFLRSAAAYAELQTLAGFFNARGGSFDSFLFTDPDDNAVTAQLFGTGNAATTAFQLVRSFGGFAEAVVDLNGAPSIYVNGTLKTVTTDYTVSGGGVVTFTSAPAAAAALTWTGSFYRRVRFAKDLAEFGKFMQGLWEARSVELLSVSAGST